ncbi:MAG TPA: hypothetical protein ENK18_04285 [Deltaproteobacteria bacterium]|nr:hypothetical protein [Deltaproteobacteria bacterium]
MNQTALRQLTSCWSEVCSAAGWLVGPSPTAHRAWWAVLAGTAAPAAHARVHPGEPIPRVLSSLYKASLGFSQVLTAILLAEDGVADTPLVELGDGSMLAEVLERGRWLVGAEQVCAGPMPMIEALYAVLAGQTTPGSAPPALEALGAPEAYTDPWMAWVGIQIAFLGAVREAIGRGQAPDDAIDRHLRPSIPCLRSALAVPDRRAAHARRLFPTGRAPDVLEAFLEACEVPVAALLPLRDRLGAQALGC